MTLTTGQRSHFADKGYVIVPNVVPRELVAASVCAITSVLGIDLEDPSTWYVRPHWNVPLYQHEAFWAVREHPAVYAVFAELLEAERLWVSIDSACFKPPLRDGDEVAPLGNFIHFDRSPDNGEQLQGLVCLNDTSEDQGGFQCVPDSLNDPVGRWLSRSDYDPQKLQFTDMNALDIERTSAKAGDLIVFTSRLAHGNGINRATAPRMAQYVTMTPAGSDAEADVRTADFQQRLAPEFFRKRAPNPEAGAVPTLSGLGRRLLGAQPWEQ